MTLAVDRQADLKFWENSIKQNATAIAHGFSKIYHEQLWRSHYKEYESFADYCVGEWCGRFSVDYIKRLIRHSDDCHIINATVTQRAIDGPMPVATKVSQAKALESVRDPEEKAEIFMAAAEQSGGRSPEVKAIREQLQRSIEEKHEAIAIGHPIQIIAEDEAVGFHHSQGWVTGYSGNTATVMLRVEHGGTIEGVEVPIEWLKAIAGPPMPEPEPAPSPTPRPTYRRQRSPQASRRTNPYELLREMARSPDISQYWKDRIREVLSDA